MEGKKIRSLGDFIEKYRLAVGISFFVAVAFCSVLLLWRENYFQPDYERQLSESERKIAELELKLTEVEKAKNELKNTASSIDPAELQALAAKTLDEASQPKPAVAVNTPPAVKGESTKPAVVNQGKININTASLAQLDALPGIGPVLSQRIIEYRQQNGLFTSIEDIKKVKGIGDKMFLKIKDQITI